MSTRRPGEAGLPLASWRVTVRTGKLVGGTPAHKVMLFGWLKVPMGTSTPLGFFSQAS